MPTKYSSMSPPQLRGRSVRRVVTAAAVLVLLASGCGGDDDDVASDQEPAGQSAPAGDGDAVVVIAEDIGFPEDEYEAEAGEVSFVYENQGSIVHTLLIEDVDGFELEVTSAGDVDEGSVQLDAGHYELFCDIPGHEVAGMVATLVVR
ncbi:MAG: hypothetical protein ACSLFO_08915 [Acidimicrobiales bacterium]